MRVHRLPLPRPLSSWKSQYTGASPAVPMPESGNTSVSGVRAERGRRSASAS